MCAATATVTSEQKLLQVLDARSYSPAAYMQNTGPHLLTDPSAVSVPGLLFVTLQPFVADMIQTKMGTS